MTFKQALICIEASVGNDKYVENKKTDKVYNISPRLMKSKPTKALSLMKTVNKKKKQKELYYGDFQFGSVGMYNNYI